jgi:hypothetical protein
MMLGRAEQVQHIANGVLLLTCDASSQVTGAEPVIDGRMAARDSIGAEVDGWRVSCSIIRKVRL